MNQSAHHGPIAEFAVDTREKYPLSHRQTRLHWEELISLRGRLESVERQLFERDVRHDELEQATRRDILKALQSAVAIVDELRRLVDDASLNLTTVSSPSTPTRGFWRSWRRKPLPVEANEVRSATWLSAIVRHAGAAAQRLGDHDIHHVELLGRDLRDVKFEGQAVHRWVGVKNKPDTPGTLVVKREIFGLWVGRLDNQLVPIQRGEVMV